MPTTNEAIRDLEIRHAVYIQRLSSSVVRKLIRILDEADAEIVAKLLARGHVLEGSFTSKRLEALLESIRVINHDAHVIAGRELRQELRDIARYEADFQSRLIQSALPIQWDIVTPTAQLLDAAVTSQPFQGRLLKEWVSELDGAKFRRLRDTVRLGVVQGETVDQIVRRVRGTRAQNYADGVMQIGRRGAEAMVRTAVSHTTGVAQAALYEANSDVIASEQWVATLDTRTCKHCMALDGQKFELGKGPKRPAHIGCRCVRVPVTKSWKELGFDIEELEPSTRASMNGQVSATETYDTWLRKQSASVQDEALGPSRGALFRSGELPVDRFTNRAGDDLTLDQIKARDAQAFEKSGLGNPIRPPRGVPQDEIARFLADPVAQTDLLRKNVRDYGRHRDFVEQVIAANKWKAEADPVVGVRHYTGAAYREWNRKLRDDLGTLEDRKLTALTVKGIDELPRYTGNIWRAPVRGQADGDALWNGASVGDDLALKHQFQSFSAESDVAIRWSGDAKVVVFAKTSPRGAIIDKVSQHPGEKEVLLPPGLRYKVVEKRVENGVRVIVVEIVDER